jgi:cytochrome c
MSIKNLAKAIALSAAVALPAMSTASEELAQKNNCLACHSIDGKLVGPSFKEISEKYKGDDAAAALLADKVKNGGGGTWGAIPMPPNPAVSDDDIAAIVEWALSL